MSDFLQKLLPGVLIAMSINPAAALAEHCMAKEPFAYVSKSDLEECPPDIQAWMDRANGCAALEAGSDPATPDQQIAMEHEQDELECVFIPCDYDRLIEKYEGNGVLTNIIKEYKTVVFGADKALICEE